MKILRFCPMSCTVTLASILLTTHAHGQTNGNDIINFVGSSQSINVTRTHPVSGQSISFVGTYNVNTSTYDGLDGDDRLLCTTLSEFLELEDLTGAPTLVSVEFLVLGDGDDVVLLDHDTLQVGDSTLIGADGADSIWASVGNDVLIGAWGNDDLSGGGGDDQLWGGNDNDKLFGGPGVDTAIFDGNLADHLITSAGLTLSVTDLVGAGGADELQGIEWLEFDDCTIPAANATTATGCPTSMIAALCDPGQPHSGSVGADLAMSTLGNLSGSGLHLDVLDGPPGEFGFFLVSDQGAGSSPVFDGVLCLSSTVGRYNPQVAATQGVPALDSIGQFDPTGRYVNLSGTASNGFGFDVPLELPFTPAGQAISPGETWFFQCWFRDVAPGGAPTANFSNMLQVTF